MFSIIQCEEVKISDYDSCIKKNKGIASCIKLNENQLKTQLNLVLEAPAGEYFDIIRGKVNAGQLEILLQFSNKDRKDLRFWWKVNNHKGVGSIVKEILDQRPFPVKGSVNRLVKHMHA